MRTLLEIFEEFSPKQLSNGQIRMKCPFRDNHTDGSGKMSFFVNPDINAYHCFSCGEKGNLIKLLTTRFDVSYFDAVELVKLTPPERKEKRGYELDIIWDFTPPREFLSRGLTKETLQHFRVGTKDDAIVIPYYDDFTTYKELLGIQTRRYVHGNRVVQNSTGFSKVGYLYNLDYSFDYVVLVEGQSDVWRLYQHGFNATALMGSTMSEFQAEKLGKFNRVYLALDNDEAGRRCTEICNYMLSKRTDVRLVPYTTKDPCECISPVVWKRAFHASTDYLEYSLAMTMAWDGYTKMKKDALKGVDDPF